jgi:uncharacterized protein (TIGR02246 family)
MKRLFLPPVALSIVAVGLVIAANDKPKPVPPDQSNAAPKRGTNNEAVKKPAVQPAKPGPDKTPTTTTGGAAAAGLPRRSPDDEAVRQVAAALVSNFNRHDAKSFAGAFTSDGEYIDEKGTIFHGRQAIEEEFAGFFTGNPTTAIELAIASTRTIAPGIVAVDGSTRFTRAKGESPVVGQCHIVAARESGKWLIASLHEVAAAAERPSHHDQLKQLEWLIGDWIEEGPQSHVHFSCRWEEGGAFLARDFSVQIGGHKTITGTQRIGYDPLTGHFKTWIFDSAGGYADGYVLAEGTNWIVHTSGVTSDGRMASGTNIFTPIDKHRIGWQGVDRIIGGERISDVEKVTLVKKPPLPAAQTK